MNDDVDTTYMADCSNVSSECERSLDSDHERLYDDLVMQNAQSDSRSESSDEDEDGIGFKNNNFMMEMSMNNLWTIEL